MNCQALVFSYAFFLQIAIHGCSGKFLSNCAKQACVESFRLSDPYKCSCSIESRNDPCPNSEVVHETEFSLKIA